SFPCSPRCFFTAPQLPPSESSWRTEKLVLAHRDGTGPTFTTKCFERLRSCRNPPPKVRALTSIGSPPREPGASSPLCLPDLFLASGQRDCFTFSSELSSVCALPSWP